MDKDEVRIGPHTYTIESTNDELMNAISTAVFIYEASKKSKKRRQLALDVVLHLSSILSVKEMTKDLGKAKVKKLLAMGEIVHGILKKD